MHVSFEYQDHNEDNQWHRISRTHDIDCIAIQDTLKSLSRQFPGCHLRALDDENQVLQTLHSE